MNINDAAKALNLSGSINRCPVAVARDIQRRLLPKYLAAFDKAAARLKNAKAKEEEVQDIAKCFQRIGKGTINNDFTFLVGVLS